MAWPGLPHSPRTYCHGDLIVEHVNHQVETDGLLPVNVRVSYGQFLAVSPPDLHSVGLARPEALADEEEEVVTVDGSVRLEEEVTDEQVCPVGCVTGTREPRVLDIRQPTK